MLCVTVCSVSTHGGIQMMASVSSVSAPTHHPQLLKYIRGQGKTASVMPTILAAIEIPLRPLFLRRPRQPHPKSFQDSGKKVVTRLQGCRLFPLLAVAPRRLSIVAQDTRELKSLATQSGDRNEEHSPIPSGPGESSQACEYTKVVGIGTRGGSIIDFMIKSEVLHNCEFRAMNTDTKALQTCLAPLRLPVGTDITKGHGTGGDRHLGVRAAQASSIAIQEAVAGTGVLFALAGTGGGTGGGVTPKVLECARAAGRIAVAIVTQPFLFEAPRRRKQAQEDIEVLAASADILIAIEQDLLLEGNPSARLTDASEVANDAALRSVKAISDLLQAPEGRLLMYGLGSHDSDHSFIKEILRSSGMVGVGHGSSCSAKVAMQEALKSPFLRGSTKGDEALVLCTLASAAPLQLDDAQAALWAIRSHLGQTAQIILCPVSSPALRPDTIEATILTTRRSPPPPVLIPQPRARSIAPSDLARANARGPQISPGKMSSPTPVMADPLAPTANLDAGIRGKEPQGAQPQLNRAESPHRSGPSTSRIGESLPGHVPRGELPSFRASAASSGASAGPVLTAGTSEVSRIGTSRSSRATGMRVWPTRAARSSSPVAYSSVGGVGEREQPVPSAESCLRSRVNLMLEEGMEPAAGAKPGGAPWWAIQRETVNAGRGGGIRRWGSEPTEPPAIEGWGVWWGPPRRGNDRVLIRANGTERAGVATDGEEGSEGGSLLPSGVSAMLDWCKGAVGGKKRMAENVEEEAVASVKERTRRALEEEVGSTLVRLTLDGVGTYLGPCSDGLPEGQGRLSYVTGDVYQGMWYRGVRHGWGIFSYANGDVFEGDWKDNAQEGEGWLHFASGDKLHAFFCGGCVHGPGVIFFASGAIFEGEFVNNYRHGEAILVDPSGERWMENWENGERRNSTLLRLEGGLAKPTRPLVGGNTVLSRARS